MSGLRRVRSTLLPALIVWVVSVSVFATIVPLALVGVLGPAAPAPVLTATKDDALVSDIDGDGLGDAGDTVRYTVVIGNPDRGSVENVAFNDTIDSNTTLVPGSVKTTPLARDDAYAATGNIAISVPAGAGLLGNDNDADGGTVTVIAFDSTSAEGGAVAVGSDGSFDYNPPPGFEGNDRFNYTIEDDEGQTSNEPGVVTITVSGMIWFVDAGATCPCDGRLTSPFDELAGSPISFAGTAADEPGDDIFVAQGAYTGGLTLLDDQRLIGDGASTDLATITGIALAAHSLPLPSFSGTDPIITSSAAGIILGRNNTIRGLTIGDTSGAGLRGSSVGTISVSETSIGGTGGALDITTGQLDMRFDALSSTSTGIAGIRLSGVSGAFAVDDTEGTIETTTATAVSIDGNPTIELDVTLRRVSANGATNGIVLRDTTGLFAVTGGVSAGVGCDSNPAVCTGGTIQNTGDAAVLLHNATNVSLTGMSLTNVAMGGGRTHGISGTSVNGFTLRNSRVIDAGGTASVDDEHSINFSGLFGTALIEDVLLDGINEDGIEVINSAGPALELTVRRATILNHRQGCAPCRGEHGISIQATGTADMTVLVDDSDFTINREGAIGVLATSIGTSVLAVTVQNSTFNSGRSFGNGAVLLNGAGGSTARFVVDGNTFTNADLVPIDLKADDTATVEYVVTDNVIDGTICSGCTNDLRRGINLVQDENGAVTALIDNNRMVDRRPQFEGIFVHARDANGSIDLTLTRNTVLQPTADFVNSITVQAEDSNSICAKIESNTAPDNGGTPGLPNFGDAIYLGERDTSAVRLERGISASNDPDTVLADNNPLSGSLTQTEGSVTVVGNGTCDAPTP